MKLISPDVFMSELGQALAADKLLQTYCQEKFGRTLLVLVGVDERNPPGPDSYPLVSFADCDEDLSEGGSDRPYLLIFSVGVWSEDFLEADNFRMLLGLPLVVGLCDQVQKAIGRAKLVAEVDFESAGAPLQVFPEFVKMSAARCSLFKSSRRPLSAD